MRCVLLSVLLMGATLATASMDVSQIQTPTAQQIGRALANSNDQYLREAGINMKDDVSSTPVPPLGFLCKSSSKTVGPCDVSFKVCPKLHHVVELRYVATACASGSCASSGEDKSADGAAKDALYALMLQHPTCACGKANTTIGTCTFDLNTCFQLDSTCTTPAFYSAATCTKNAVSASYCCAAQAEDAAKGAMTALNAKMSFATTCA